MIKVVLDTNVIVSGLNFPASKPAKILELAVFGVIQNFTSDYILSEVNYILSKKFRWQKDEIKSVMSWIKIFSKKVNPKKIPFVVQHIPDNKILACAIFTKASFIISGDKHLTDLKKYNSVRVLNSNDFINYLVIAK